MNNSQPRSLCNGQGIVELEQSAENYFGGNEPSFSSIKHLLVSPQHYFQMITRKVTNPRADMGTAIHHYLQNRPHLVKVSDKKGTELVKEKEAWRAETDREGIVVGYSVNSLAQILEQYSRNCHKIMEIRQKSLVETGFYFCYRDIIYRTRTDFMWQFHHNITDIKSTSEAETYDQFKKWIVDHNYTMQFAMHKLAYEYVMGNKLKNYNIIACYTGKNQEAFKAYSGNPVKLYELSDELMELGLRQFDLATDRYKEFVLDKRPLHEFVERL